MGKVSVTSERPSGECPTLGGLLGGRIRVNKKIFRRGYPFLGVDPFVEYFEWTVMDA